jgi:hypothetical protein
MTVYQMLICTGETRIFFVHTVGPGIMQTSASGFWGKQIRQTWARIPKKYLKRGLLAGKVVEVAALTDVQDKVYDEPTILLANRVSGEEEIPEGVVAVVTPDAPDILSHSSVRARNMKVSSAPAPQLAVFGAWSGP